MWLRVSLLILCCAVRARDALSTGKPDKSVRSGAEEEGLRQSPRRDPGGVGAEGGVRPPDEELDNEENLLSQLLGDYDKVKTVSSGSDCVCRCIVHAIKRSDCSRIHDSEPASQSGQDFYTVETVTKGTDCKKCVCMAPPSAVNPCEADYRFKKLQEASKDDIKLATIIELLESSLYGLDLLKLHSVTTRLLTRMDNMEKAFIHNSTVRAREKQRVKERAKEKEREKQKQKVNDLQRAGQKTGEAAYANKQKNYEGQPKKNQPQNGLEQPTRNKTGTQKPIKDKNIMVIKGVTFYKAEEEIYKEEDEQKGTGKRTAQTASASVDLVISDHLPTTRTVSTRSPAPSTPVSSKVSFLDLPRRPSRPAATQQPTAPQTSTQQTTTTTTPAPTTTKPTTELITNIPTTPKPPTRKLVTTSEQTTATIARTLHIKQYTTSASDTNIGPPTDASPTVVSRPGPKTRLTWTENPADQPKATKKPAVCKDTVASISEPVQQNTYGLSDGAWMRDARGHGNVIYLTNGHYGSNLLEFRDLSTLKSGQASNSYKLPYSFTGTGHVVFNGAFYYNRAFSRDVIRYDLRHRYVAAWTTLHDAILEEQAQRTQSEVEFAVDESGLWLLYPALDTEGFHQEVILLIQLRPRDLQQIQSFRTGLRRGRYGNIFLVCGVLYAVDSMEHRYANVTYAFDTHTLTHTVPSLSFTNTHARTSQLTYCPLDKKLYAWDDGHQMTYDVVFAY
ncbi:olfactomedin-like protein 2B [Pempheris klunzingeri]|uniref:olfactomedin-like protein 2B n=1 Tax=Pempheris klunzingeri TaxID=3127111 RepID=UPI003980D227